MPREEQKTFALHAVAEAGLDPVRLSALIEQHETQTRNKLTNLWEYYRNPLRQLSGGPRTAQSRNYRLGQERGLPLRLTNPASIGANIDDRASGKREIVVENDIAWRIHTMIDFLFGRPLRIVSAARDEQLAARIDETLEAIWERSGGLAMLQQAGLLGHVYGSVDFLVRIEGDDDELRAASGDAQRLAELIRIEPVDPMRGVPLMSADDWRALDGYAVRVTRGSGRSIDGREVIETVTEVFSPTLRQKYITTGDETKLVAQAENRVSAGEVPVVHVQNASQPFVYEGLGEVEPLVPLQDELNTRLSDRANRVTMQSFKMYLAKGIDGFEKTPIHPGLLLSTDNVEASITAFGGDAVSPREDRHIEEVREAMDKLSGVPPLATGVVRAKIGNLTSENALRLTLQGLLARTMRKRITYGRGIVEVSRMILAALDRSGALATSAGDRAVRLEWPDPISSDTAEQVRNAKAKTELGVSPERVLGELGYATADAGIE